MGKRVILFLLIIFNIAGCGKEVPSIEELNTINDQIIKYFETTDHDYQNVSFNYVDEDNRLVIVGLLDNSREKQEEFRNKVLDSPYIKFEQSKALESSKNSHLKVDDDIDMKIIIDSKSYNIVPENNETVLSLMQLLPLELNMKELNGNEKFYYLNTTLPTNSSVPTKINKGDVMLYQDNCLVIFYKDFNTDYEYTKIGHIADLPDLGSDNIKVTFSK